MGTGHGRSRTQRGMALLLALIAVLLIAALLGGIMMLGVSHLALSGANSAYANALSLAEAGVNWELWKMSWYRTEMDWSDITVEFPPGSGRTFTVHVEADANPTNGLWVISTGLVDGARRTVRVHAEGYGPNGDYALFGIDILNMGGNFTVHGASGSNGVVNGGGNSFLLDGNFWYCGSSTGNINPDDPQVTGEVHDSDIAEYFPTVNEIANQWAQDHWDDATDQGVDYFSAHNDNETICDATGKRIGVQTQGNTIAINWKEAGAAPTALPDGTAVPAELQGPGKHVVVLTPGDYYFTELQVAGSNYLLIHDAGGPEHAVNIWLGPEDGGGNADKLTGNCQFTSGPEQANNFHLYEGSHRDLIMEGTTDFYGNVYAYNGSPGNYWGEIIFRGTCNIVGSVVGYDVTKVSGNATVTYPSGGGPGAGDSGPILYYGAGSWEELNGL